MREIDTIFFDLDGTLSDPKVGITGAIRFALENLGCDAPPPDELTWCIGPPLRASFVSLLGGEECADQAIELYREYFSAIGMTANTLYDGILTTLETLQTSGRRLFVATSKPQVFADLVIDHFEIRRHFLQVFGSELDGTRSDKSDLLRHALVEAGANPASTIMIGDRKHDVIGATNNGMTAIGVLYGYGGRTELTEAGAKYLVASPAEITRLFEY